MRLYSTARTTPWEIENSTTACVERWTVCFYSTAITTSWEIHNSTTACVKRGTIRFCSTARTTTRGIQNSSTTNVEVRVVLPKPTHSNRKCYILYLTLCYS
jgi:hypothetical protein